MAELFRIPPASPLRRPSLVIPTAVLLLLGVVYLDWLTGPEFVMGEFYLLPVAMVTVILGLRPGVLMAIVTVIVWGAAEWMGTARYSHHLIAALNGLMHLAYLALVVWLLSIWRGIGARLETQVRERTAELQAEVTERRQAEMALHALALKLSDAEDAERRRLAHDIHDTVGQSLTLLKLRLQSMDTTLVKASGDTSTTALDEEIGILDRAIKQTRTLMFELHPPMLDDLGIVPALRGFAKELQRQTSIEITIVEEGAPRTLAQPLAGYLFRSIKELISNAITHGRSSEIVVTLYWWPTSVRSTVDDNGQGFDTATARGGLGLAGIRERVATLGGSISIESVQGQGTRAIINVPIA